MKKDVKIIFGSSTPRSGGTLLSNILSINENILITKDLVHFFRYFYKKYTPLEKNLRRLSYEFCLRIKYRKSIIFDAEDLFIYLKKNKSFTYDKVLKNIFRYILIKQNKKIKIIGEIANSEWHNIGNFLKLNKTHKAFQIIRDPRAIISSWKKLTYEKGYRYLIMIFYWLDSINYSEKYSKQFSKKRYLKIKFEDIHSEPVLAIKRIYNFLDIKNYKISFNKIIWQKKLNSHFIDLNVSSYNNKISYGFSKKRTINWKKNIKDWEVVLIEHLLGDKMKKLNYELLNYNNKLLKKGIKIIKKDKLLLKYYKKFIKDQTGTHDKLRDPSKPENWSASNYSKNLRAKFIDTTEYKNYINELRKIKNF